MQDLKKLKSDVLAYCERLENNGGRTGEYDCPYCKEKQKTNLPNELDDIWDSAAMCYECGKMHFVVKRFNSIEATIVKN